MSQPKKPVIALALALDWLVGDPPNKYHPVAWIGSLIYAVKARRPYDNPYKELAFGAGLVVFGSLLLAKIGQLVSAIFERLPWPLNWLSEALMLKMMFSMNGLVRAADEIQGALNAEDLPEARRLVSWHLVSRDTSQLDEAGVAAATIESLAENTSDGVVAPLFYYAIGGLPGALSYRFINTCDSIMGYRDLEYEWLGKVPARLDDVVNFTPARLTAASLLAADAVLDGDAQHTLAITRRDARLTESPNAGYPMAAMAGALDVELEKEGHYRLGGGQRRPSRRDIPRAKLLVVLASALAGVFFILLPWTQRKKSRKGQGKKNK